MGMRRRRAGVDQLGDEDITALVDAGAGARPASATSPRTGTGTACCSTRRCGRTASSATRPSAPNVKGRWLDRAGARKDTERIVERVRRAHARHRRPRRRAVRRQPAEAHRRPGDERRPGRAHRRPPDPRRRRRRPGRDLGPHPRRRAATGLAVLLISADLDELIGLSDTSRSSCAAAWSPRSTRAHVTPEAARLGHDRRGGDDGSAAARDRRPRRGSSSTLAAPVARRWRSPSLITSLVLLVGRRPGRRDLADHVDVGDAAAVASSLHRQPGDRATTCPALAVAIGFRMNLFNIGVDGQYRLAAFSPPRSAACVCRCPAAAHPADRRSSRWRVGASGPASPALLR